MPLRSLQGMLGGGSARKRDGEVVDQHVGLSLKELGQMDSELVSPIDYDQT